MPELDEREAWAVRWQSSVTDTSMTQRKLSVIERHGGIEEVTRIATKLGIHLVQLTDDKGDVRRGQQARVQGALLARSGGPHAARR